MTKIHPNSEQQRQNHAASPNNAASPNSESAQNLLLDRGAESACYPAANFPSGMLVLVLVAECRSRIRRILEKASNSPRYSEYFPIPRNRETSTGMCGVPETGLSRGVCAQP